MTIQEKFQHLLRELFQFDSTDLDFGIYRIMNYKRDAIEKFIVEDLPKAISDDLEQGLLAEQDRAAAELEEIAQRVEDNFGEGAIEANGELVSFHNTPLGAAYLNARAKAAGARRREAVEIDIFNHLYAFFSRYYEDGDFISKRRYAKHQQYAIPYNGEEVHLHWANRDQYYVKTGEHFRDYDWKAPNGIAVRFRIRAADVEQNNVKGDKRFFLPLVDETHWDHSTRAIAIPFEYRPLTEGEKRDYGTKNQQENIIAAAVDAIPKRLGKATDALAALTGERRRDGDGEPVSHLAHHLRQYTRRSTSDFFIHKDLKGFLARELDFYLKNEVLNLDEMTAIGENMVGGWFQMMRVIKVVGGQIIDFLNQIECFQKMLWEKRKFITETHYCIAVGVIDEKFYPAIAACEPQWAKWKALFHIDEDAINLFNSGKDTQGKRIAFMQAHPTLMLDTRHFDADFTDRLLASFDDLDGMTDGLLIHSENYQALNLLQEKYAEQVKGIYIDPPYNTNMAPILYKNGYKHSSWMSVVEQGLLVARDYMADNGVLSVAIDDEEAYNLKALVDNALGSERYAGTVIVQSNPGGRDINTHLAISHDYCLFYANPEQKEMLLPRKDAKNTQTFNEGSFRRTGGLSSPKERENSEFAFYYTPADMKILGVGGKRVSSYPAVYEPSVIHCCDAKSDSASIDEPTDFFARHPDVVTLLPQFNNGDRGVWRWSDREKILAAIGQGDIFLKKSKGGKVSVTLRSPIRSTYKPKTVWSDSKYSATTYGTILLQDILGAKGLFSYPKSVHTVQDSIESAIYGFSNATVLDYFAGSGTTGHAVINLNREDGGRRKFILVEMGEYFDTVLLPRIEKITFAPEWKDGKPKRMATPDEAERSPRIVKSMRVESYEDALNNIAFDDAATQLKLEDRFDDYLIKYMLQWETKDSETLLNVVKIASPFTYRLRVHTNGETQERTADIPETFNYLLGLNVRTRRVYEDEGRRYVVYRGETRDAPGREVAVIWRKTEGWERSDFDRDRRFVAEQGLIDDVAVVYVNGDSCIPGAITVEPMFKARMFAEVGR